MRIFAVLMLLCFSGCKCMGEKLLETATGGQVKMDGNTVTIKDNKGESVTFSGEGKDGKGTLVVKNDKGEVATLSGDESGVKIQSKDGTTEWGTGKVPDGFPLAVMEGAKVETGAVNKTAKGDSFTLMASLDKDPAAIAEFYEKELKAKGFKVEKVQTMGAGSMVVLNGKKDKLTATCTIARGKPDKPSSLIIAWQPN